MVYANGDTYEGGWANDMREGIGAFYCISKGRNTLVYTGEWSRDKPSVETRIQTCQIKMFRAMVCSMGIINVAMKGNGLMVSRV